MADAFRHVLALILLVGMRHGMTPPGFFIPSAFQVLWIVLGFVGLAWVVRCVGRLFLYANRGAAPNARIGWITVAIPLIITSLWVAAESQLSMRVCFLLSLRQFDGSAATATPGTAPAAGTFGVYTVTDVHETAPGEFFYVTMRTPSIDPDAIGFMYVPSGQSLSTPASFNNQVGRRRICTHISGNWYWAVWGE